MHHHLHAHDRSALHAPPVKICCALASPTTSPSHLPQCRAALYPHCFRLLYATLLQKPDTMAGEVSHCRLRACFAGTYFQKVAHAERKPTVSLGHAKKCMSFADLEPMISCAESVRFAPSTKSPPLSKPFRNHCLNRPKQERAQEK